MNANIEKLSQLVNKTYIQQSFDALNAREKLIKHLIEQRKCPETGWDEFTIEMFIQKLSLMDSNNFPSNVGVGEREARIACNLIAKRHFHFGHGIGRSGDLNEVQPKAAGSSLINILANRLVLDVLRTFGARSAEKCVIVPMATGMSLVLCMLTLRHKRPNAKYVIWPRIDQKSCFKCIKTAGYEPLIIENKLNDDALETNMPEIKECIQKYGVENILCILSTTSSFAPKIPDNLEEIALLCKEINLPHIVNNAYGVQSSKCMHLIEQSAKNGRLDAFVQSCDKNFLVPVGGSLIASHSEQFINDISKNYPGRGSSTPSFDVLITLLHLGVNGYRNLLNERKEQMKYLKSELEMIAKKYGERVLETKANLISIAITLNTFKCSNEETEIGSKLFLRGVSGARVVISDGAKKLINGYEFVNWSSHSNCYPHSYLTAAAALGVTKDDIDKFIKRLDSLLSNLRKKNEKQK